MPDSVLVPRDRWVVDLREWLGPEPVPHLVELIIHLATLASGRPTAAWRRMCMELAAREGAREFGRRALAGLAALAEGATAVPELEAVVVRTSYDTFAYFPEPKVATAAIHALGAIPGPAAPAALQRLLAEIHHTGDRRQLETALKASAALAP